MTQPFGFVAPVAIPAAAAAANVIIPTAGVLAGAKVGATVGSVLGPAGVVGGAVLGAGLAVIVLADPAADGTLGLDPGLNSPERAPLPFKASSMTVGPKEGDQPGTAYTFEVIGRRSSTGAKLFRCESGKKFAESQPSDRDWNYGFGRNFESITCEVDTATQTYVCGLPAGQLVRVYGVNITGIRPDGSEQKYRYEPESEGVTGSASTGSSAYYYESPLVNSHTLLEIKRGVESFVNPDIKPEPKPRPLPIPIEPLPEPAPEPEPEPEPDEEEQDDPEPVIVPSPDNPDTEPVTIPGPAPAEPQPEPEPNPFPNPQPAPDPLPLPAPLPGVSPVIEPQPEPNIQPAPSPRPQPIPAPAPVPDPTPAPGVSPIPSPVPLPSLPQPQPTPTPITSTPTKPDGNPRPDPEPAPITTPPGTHFPVTGGPPVNGGGTRPDTGAIAREIGRVEQKVSQLLNKADPTFDTGNLLDLLGTILNYLQNQKSGTTYTLNAVCECPPDADDCEEPELVINTTGGDYRDETLARIDALAEMLQPLKTWKQPICGDKPVQEGNWRTIQFKGDRKLPSGRSFLSKTFRYRSKGSQDLERLVNHWKDFTWEAGPVCVINKGLWWGVPQVWAASADEGRRVIEHAAVEAGISLDKSEWIFTSSRDPRYGQESTMSVRIYKNASEQWYGITNRDTPSDRPLVMEASPPIRVDENINGN